MSVVQDLELTTPEAVMRRLTEIETDLAIRQNVFEEAARNWFLAKREIERNRARALLQAGDRSVTEKKARADAATDPEALAYEAEYEGVKAAVRVLETRANISMALLKAMGRS